MSSLYLLFSHTLTSKQQQGAEEKLRVQAIHYLPEELQNLWTNVPADVESIKDHIKPIQLWLAKRAAVNDYILIQGDFGATYLMVEWALKNDCIPIYATTEREVISETNSSGEVEVKRVFRHVRFRQYESCR